MVSSEELECGCCYELLLNPTTLTCGHSFCRYCLAKWFEASKKTECPECRQTWIGFPQVNVKLRNIIEKSFSNEIKARERSQKSQGHYHKVLKQFEENAKKESRSESLSSEELTMLIGVVVLVIAAILIVLVIGILYWIFLTEPNPHEVIYSKSAPKWSIKEVVSWAQVFCDQLESDYSERFEKARINGRLLLSLNEEDLQSPPLNISMKLHRKAILEEIKKLNVTGVKTPVDLWEYKNAHRTYSVFMLFMLQDFPRLTILFHRFEYDSALLPFMRAVIAKPQCDQMEENDESTCSDKITKRDKLWFYTEVMVLPYYLISQFSWYYIDVQFFTVWIIVSHCVMLTLRELLQLSKANISLSTVWNTAIDSTLSFCVTCVLYRIAVIFIPDIVLDFIFFCKIYYGPVDTASSIKNGHLQTNAIGKVLSVVYAGIDKILLFVRFLFNRRRRPVELLQ